MSNKSHVSNNCELCEKTVLRDWALEECGAFGDSIEQFLSFRDCVLPIDIARRASIRSHQRRFIGSIFSFPAKMVGRDEIGATVDRLVGYPFAMVRDGSISDLLLVCACRSLPIFENRADPLRSQGFQGYDATDDLCYRADWAEENFDRLLELFTIDTITAHRLHGRLPTDVGRRFLSSGGAIPLFISTRESCPERIGSRGNVGDNFGLTLLRSLTNLRIRPVGVSVDPHSEIVLTVGSVIEHARDRALVWGSGAISELRVASNVVATRSEFLGVRGPRTREQILRRYKVNPPVIGDPGLLLCRVAEVPPVEPDIEVGFVVHSVDKAFFSAHYPHVYSIPNYGTLDEFLRGIARCKYVISTGLHGIVFAHALGKPAVPISVGNRITGGDFKFRDYANSLGHYNYHWRRDLSLAPSIATEDWVRHITDSWHGYEGQRPKELIERLLATFPFPLRH